MPVNLKGRSFLTLMDFSPEEIRYLLDLAATLKAKKRAGIYDQPLLKGKNVVLLFEKTSTRTRCAFETACHDEGAHVTFLDSKSSQMGKKESLEDTAKVLGRFFDGIDYRGFEQEVVENGLNLTPEQRQVLGMTEHLRWCAFHYVMGYRPMPPETFEERAAEYLRQKQETGASQVRITKNAAEREHACLIPWDELDELSRRENEITGKNLDYKEMDIQNVLAIEKLLRKCRGNGWS